MLVDGDGSSDMKIIDQSDNPVSPQRIGGGKGDTFLVAQLDVEITYTIYAE